MSNFRVGQWLVQPHLNRVTRDEHTVLLEPKVMEVLVVLTEHAGDAVRREDLMETVWPGLVVTEEALTRCISALRSAFEDDYKNPKVIETIRKTGYRLIAPVSLEAKPTTPQLERPAAPAPTFHVRRLPQRWPWIAGLLAVLSLGLWGFFPQPNSTPPSALRIVPFTAFPGNEMEPAFSPDGNHVAFAWDDQQGKHMDVYIKSLASETPFQVTSDSAYEVSPTWSPDGSRLAFARVWDTCEILIMPVFGGPERKVTECGGWGNPQLDWSPDAETPMIAISESYARHAPHRIVLLSLETLEKRPLTHPLPQHQGDRKPRFSPDGKTVAFIRTSDQTSDIYLVPTSGGTPQRLTFDNLNVAGLAWMPDSKNIVYTSNRTGTHSLWRIPAMGGTPELLFVSGESMINPALLAQDGSLMYEQWSNETNIYRIPLNATSNPDLPRSPFIASTYWDGDPQYAPTGDRIAFTSNRSGAFEIWLSNADGTPPVQLTTFEGPVARHPTWSPDATQLAFDSRAEGNADIYLTETTGTPPRRLTTDPAVDVHPSWSVDGQWIYFSSDRSGTWQIWKIPAVGGNAQQVTPNGGFAVHAAPDGKSLYFTKHDTSGIWHIPIAGGDESLIVPTPASTNNNAWHVAKGGIYFLQSGNHSPLTLAFYNTATDQISDAAALPVSMQPHNFTISPDGTWLLSSQLDRSESDLVLAKGLLR